MHAKRPVQRLALTLSHRVYLDCFDQIPLSCDKEDPQRCTAIRNRNGNNASVVTPQQVAAYIAGKKAGLRAATKRVEAGSPGGIFTAKTWDTYASHDPYGANAALVSAASNPATTLDTVNAVMKKNGYRCARSLHRFVLGQSMALRRRYLIFGHGYSNLARKETDLGSTCTDAMLAAFLLAMEP